MSGQRDSRHDESLPPAAGHDASPRGRRGELVAFILLAVVLAVFPLVVSPAVLNVGVYAMIYGIAAIGLTLLMGLAGQVSLGQAGFFAIGAYTHALLLTKYDVPAVLSAVIAIVVASLIGLIVGLPLLRLRGHYLALAMLGFGIIISVLASQSDYLGGTSGIFGVPKPAFGGRTYDSPSEFFWFLTPFVVIALLLARNIAESRMGRALGALHDSEVAAETLGVDAFRLRVQIFVVAAGYAGLAGVFFAHWLSVVNPNAANFLLSTELLLISVVGGLASVWGAIVGAFAVEYLDEGLARLIPRLIPDASGEVQLIGFGIILVAVMIFLPGGIVEAWTRLTGRFTGGRSTTAAVEEDEPGPQEKGATAAAASPEAAAAGMELHSDRERPERGSTILEVRELTKRFGGVTAVDAVSFDVLAGEIFALIGPNGAGKTTCFNMASGVLDPTSGTVNLQGTRIDGRKPHVFAQNGATRTFQNLQVFGSSTVLGNVMVGRHLQSRAGLFKALLHLPARKEEKETAAAARRIIDLLGLGGDAHRLAADLPFGRQRLMEIARALALEPNLLMLDEPLAGLSGADRRAVATLLRRLRADGMTIVLVEHDVDAVLALADRVAVLDDGVLIALGTPDEIREDPHVISAYLGVAEDDADVAAAQELAHGRTEGDIDARG